jgi:membrane-associated phospholipid phosphatase
MILSRYTDQVTGHTDTISILLAMSGVFMYIATFRVEPKYSFGTRLDAKIPLLPIFVLPYIAFFPYLIVTVVTLWRTPLFEPFLIAIAIAGWMAGVIWYVLPAAMMRPQIKNNDLLSRLVKYIYHLDAEANTFPSAHVFYALICSYFLSLAHPQYMTLFAFVGTLIVLSTLFVRQHHLADVFGGAAWAFTAIYMAYSLV